MKFLDDNGWRNLLLESSCLLYISWIQAAWRMPLVQFSCVMAILFYARSSLPVPVYYFYFAYLSSKIEEIFPELSLSWIHLMNSLHNFCTLSTLFHHISSMNPLCLLSHPGFLVAQMVKNLPAMWETQVRSLGWEDPLGSQESDMIEGLTLGTKEV